MSLVVVGCWLLADTGLLLRSRFRWNWLEQRTRSSDPPKLRSRRTAVCPGGLSSLPAPPPFTFITGVGAGVPDSWSELSSGRGGGGDIGAEVACNSGPYELLLCASAARKLGLELAESSAGGPVCCWSYQLLQWFPRSRPGQRTHRQRHTSAKPDTLHTEH